MFLEVSAKKYEKLKEKLEAMGIPYQVTEQVLSNNKTQVYHLEFGALIPDDIKKITQAYESVSNEINLKETPRTYTKGKDNPTMKDVLLGTDTKNVTVDEHGQEYEH